MMSDAEFKELETTARAERIATLNEVRRRVENMDRILLRGRTRVETKAVLAILDDMIKEAKDE